MTTVGFDFGNLNCVIARCGRGGVDVLLNGSSNRLVTFFLLFFFFSFIFVRVIFQSQLSGLFSFRMLV